MTREAIQPRETDVEGKEGEGGVAGLVVLFKIDTDINELCGIESWLAL